jgi:hypothetical protein
VTAADLARQRDEARAVASALAAAIRKTFWHDMDCPSMRGSEACACEPGPLSTDAHLAEAVAAYDSWEKTWR